MTTEQTQQESSMSEDIAASLVMDEELPQEESAEEQAQTAEGAIEEAIEALKPPPKWDRRYKEVFEGWGAVDDNGQPMYPNGRQWQEAMLELYNNGQSYTTKVEQERAQLRRAYEQTQQYAQSWGSVLKPYTNLLQQWGVTPDQAVRQGMGLLQSLRDNPKATLMRLAREAQIDLNSVAQEQPWESPEAKRIEQLERRLAAQQREQMERQRAQTIAQMQRLRHENASQLQQFAEATDDSGEPLHPHLDQVADTMAELIYGRENLRRQNPNLPSMGLDEAYERACKLNPDISSAQAVASEKTKLAKEAAEAKKAKEAAKRVPAGTAGKGKTKRSLREEIIANLQSNE